MADIILDLFVNEEERKKRCVEEVNAVLAKYKCMFNPSITISAQGIQASVHIIPIIDPNKLTQGIVP